MSSPLHSHKIRVLIVDDSAVMRRILSKNLASDPLIEIVGFASNGLAALEKIPQLTPDLVTLDIEMPDMDGIQALVKIHLLYPTLPVIMVSSINPRDASATLDALTLGASDYVMKPAEAGERADRTLCDELLPKIKALCVHRAARARSLPDTGRPAIPERIDVLAIGISTGGPNALMQVLSQFPADFPVPILIVQHMPAMFTKLLAERLSTQCQFSVQEGKSGAILRPGQAWLAPGDFHMTLVRDAANVRIQLDQKPAENACRPSVDALFRTVSQVYGAHALAVIMTGMGSDGLRGCRQMREAQSQIIAQDEATSVVWGMPGSVVREGLADKVLPLMEIAGEVIERIRSGRTMLSL